MLLFSLILSKLIFLMTLEVFKELDRHICQNLFISLLLWAAVDALSPPINTMSLCMLLNIHWFNGKTNFIYTGRYPGGPELINFSV